jgi:hypothetical protein
MRKDILLGVLLTVSVCALKAQQDTEGSGNLSVSFANSGLEATRAIRQCSSTMSLDGGGVIIPSATQKFIDRAEGAAKTDAEKAVVALLKALFQAKLNTNMSRAVITMTGISPACNERLKREADGDEAIAASEMQQRRCRVALRVILHRRSYAGTPRECENIAP